MPNIIQDLGTKIGSEFKTHRLRIEAVETDKQENLVSGTNIKTINGTSVLGSGDIVTTQTTISGNAGTATKLSTARTISLTGDVTGNVSFDGSANVSITATVADDSHNHVISNVDGLQVALDSKVDKVSKQSLDSNSALRVSGTTVSLYKGDGTFDSITTQDTVYTLPTATSTVKGGIEIFSDTVQTVASNSVSTTAGRTYGIQLNSDGQAVVNVPWSDNNTVYTHPNSGVTAGTYSKVTVNAQGHITTGASLSASDIPSLDASKITSGTIDPARLPSFVDDVLEFANLAGFPTTGEAGKIYIALDTNKSYRWSGSAYVYITSGAVDSVAGKTGVVTLVKADVGLANVDNTSDANKPISTATQNALNTKVDTSTNQTIEGVKTFSSTIAGSINGNAGSATTLTGLTATVAELNKIDGFTGTVTDLNYAKDLRETGVTATQFDYLDGVTSSIQTQLNAKAPLASPEFTGTPTAPTAAVGTNTTQLATTKFVSNAIAANVPVLLPFKLDIITSSSSWVCPEGVNIVYVFLQAGGGGGGGSGYYSGGSGKSAYSGYSTGGGGGAGGKVFFKINVTPGNSYSIVVGSGGSGGGGSTSSSTTGGTGGTTSGFGFSVTGGTGGLGGKGVNSARSASGTNGNVSSAYISSTGYMLELSNLYFVPPTSGNARPNSTAVVSGIGGKGTSATFAGVGGTQTASTAAGTGTAGSLYGGGGEGGNPGTSSTMYTGGAGAAGIVYIAYGGIYA